MDSILNSIKKLLGMTEDYTHFDQDIILHINSVFMILNQLGVGPKEGYRIEDATNTWDEYLEPGSDLELVKSYMNLKVKLLFDPPVSSVVMETMRQMINEFEWRLNVSVDKNTTEGEMMK